MNKLLLLALLSFSTLATESIDLSKGGIYYCADAAVAQIKDGRGTIAMEGRFTLTVKANKIIASQEGYADTTWDSEFSRITLNRDYAVATRFDKTIFLDSNKGKLYFNMYKSSGRMPSGLQIIRTGTCVPF